MGIVSEVLPAAARVGERATLFPSFCGQHTIRLTQVASSLFGYVTSNRARERLSGFVQMFSELASDVFNSL